MCSSSQSSSAVESRSCCRGSLTCIPPELGDASLSGVVAGCQCRRPSGQSSCPVPSVTMSLTAVATSPSAWAAPTRCVRPAYTNCTARLAPLIRHQYQPISTCCRSTVPCCSWLVLRWVRKKEGVFMSKRCPLFVCAHDVCLLGPRCAAGEPEQCSRSWELWGLQGVRGRAGSLPKTYQRSKRFVCVCVCVFLMVNFCFSDLWTFAKETGALHTKCAGAAVEQPVQLGIHACHTSHDAWKLLYFYGTEGKISSLRNRIRKINLTETDQWFVVFCAASSGWRCCGSIRHFCRIRSLAQFTLCHVWLPKKPEPLDVRWTFKAHPFHEDTFKSTSIAGCNRLMHAVPLFSLGQRRKFLCFISFWTSTGLCEQQIFCLLPWRKKNITPVQYTHNIWT